MNKAILLYGASFVFILTGLLFIKAGVKKESMKSAMMKVNYVPTKNYGKFFQIALGILCVIIGVALLIIKSK